MNGKTAVLSIVLSAVVVGAGVWYAQERAYYRPIEAGTPEAVIRLTDLSGVTAAVAVTGFEGIDAASSPLRFRACFALAGPAGDLAATHAPYPDPEPRIAPRQFPCFDAVRIGDDLENGAARAYLGEPDILPGFDRVVAVYPDGSGFAWHQPNDSLEE